MLKIYFKNTSDLPVALVLAIPLLLIYELGLLIVGWDALNGADFITQLLLAHLDRTGFLIFNGILLLGFGAAVAGLDRRGRLNYSYYLPLIAESTAYALSMGSLILFVMDKTYLLGPADLTQTSILTRVVISAGAGLHEELVFRLAMMSGLLFLWPRVPGVGNTRTAPAAALVISSVLFSLAHFTAEPFQWFPFWYRSLAGAFFGVLFWRRGFAVAAYTHAIYDIYVLIL